MLLPESTFFCRCDQQETKGKCPLPGKEALRLGLCLLSCRHRLVLQSAPRGSCVALQAWGTRVSGCRLVTVVDKAKDYPVF